MTSCALCKDVSLFGTREHCDYCHSSIIFLLVICTSCVSKSKLPRRPTTSPITLGILCHPCFAFANSIFNLLVSTMSREELHRLPIKTLKTYCQMYGYNITGLFEKSEIEEYISSRIVGETEMRHYRSQMTERLKTVTLPRRFGDFVEGLVHSLFGESNQPPDRLVETVEYFFKETRQNTRPQASTSSPNSHVQNSGSNSSHTQSNAPSNAHPNHQPTPQAVPQRNEPSPTQSTQPTQSSPTSLITLENLIENNIDPALLSIKQLRNILLLERISLSNLVEKKDLIERVSLLLRNRKVELEIMKQADQSNTMDDLLCKICLVEASNCVFLECGHLVCCLDCGNQIFKTRKECPMCRSIITRVVHTFRV